MFAHVVVGVDDYQAGLDALALAKQLVSRDGKLMLVYVQVLMIAPAPDSDPAWQIRDRRRAMERLDSLCYEAHVDAELLVVQAGSVAAGLHEAVRRHGDLLAIGASRRDDYERELVGDDTREVLADPPSHVAVAPAGYATRPARLESIGVAYNGSSESERALALARELARQRHARLSAFEAVREPMYVHDLPDDERKIEEGVAKTRERLGELGDVEPHAGSGDAVEELARYAASVDLLVLGSHEHEPIDRLRGGSTSQRLADSARCALLVLSSAGRPVGA